MLLINVAGTTACSTTALFCGNYSFIVLLHIGFTNSTLPLTALNQSAGNLKIIFLLWILHLWFHSHLKRPLRLSGLLPFASIIYFYGSAIYHSNQLVYFWSLELHPTLHQGEASRGRDENGRNRSENLSIVFYFYIWIRKRKRKR